jgi:uncharacterized protein
MNKPAPKEPSMDEILSSIRQIIADDDAAVAPKKPSPPPAAAVTAAPPPRPVMPPMTPIASSRSEPEPLALTPAQMLRDADPEPESEPAAVLSFADILGGDDAPATPEALADAPPLVDPEDIAFEVEDSAEAMAGFGAAAEEPAPVAPPPPPAPAPVPRYMPPPVRPAPSAAMAAPMPDPNLSRDMAEKLLAPTTDAAVKHTFAKLNGVSMVGAGVTLDELMRDMLRPMLKEWLDENLPTLVERMVEKEIARISRGGE